MSGQIHAFFGAGAGIVSLVKQGKLRALAYTGPAVTRTFHSFRPRPKADCRLALNPSDSTEILAPAGTPAAIINTLNAAINDSLRSPDIPQVLRNRAEMRR